MIRSNVEQALADILHPSYGVTSKRPLFSDNAQVAQWEVADIMF